jgi:hypothetical protein
MARYSAIRDSLKTGDIVFFSGNDAISSIIKLFSGGKWSHVGMVWRLKEFDNIVFIWESIAPIKVSDLEAHAALKGVQLVALCQRVRLYNGEICIRQLNKPVTPEMLCKLAECWKALASKTYEERELELLKAVYDGIGGASSGEDLSSLFCSELIAEAYQAMGLLAEYPEGLPSNEYTPMDFSSHRKLELMQGYALGSEIEISC